MEEQDSNKIPKEEGLHSIDVELKYYDILKYSQTSRGLSIFLISVLYIPMMATLGLIGFPWFKILGNFIVLLPLLYLYHKRVFWVYIALPVLLFADAIFTILVGWLSFKLLILPITLTPLLYQAFIVEKEHRKMKEKAEYVSDYVTQNKPVSSLNTSPTKHGNIFKKRIVFITILLVMGVYSYFRSPEEFDITFGSVLSSPIIIISIIGIFAFWFVLIRAVEKK